MSVHSKQSIFICLIGKTPWNNVNPYSCLGSEGRAQEEVQGFQAVVADCNSVLADELACQQDLWALAWYISYGMILGTQISGLHTYWDTPCASIHMQTCITYHTHTCRKTNPQFFNVLIKAREKVVPRVQLSQLFLGARPRTLSLVLFLSSYYSIQLPGKPIYMLFSYLGCSFSAVHEKWFFIQPQSTRIKQLDKTNLQGWRWLSS